MTRFTRHLEYPSSSIINADRSTSVDGGVWIAGLGHLSKESTREFRDFLNEIVDGPVTPAGRFAAIRATLTEARGEVNLSRTDLDDVPWKSDKPVDGITYFADDEIESFEVLFEGFPNDDQEV